MIQVLQQLNFLQHGIAIGSMFVAFQNFDGAIDFMRYLASQNAPNHFLSAKRSLLMIKTYFEYFRKETFANFVEVEVTHVVQRGYGFFEGMTR